MRVLYATDTRETGGAERYLATLAERVASVGHETLLHAPQASLVAWFEREAPSVRVARTLDDGYRDAATAPARAAMLLELLPGLVRSLRRLAPDVVHVNNGGFPGSDLCRITLLAARLAGVPRRLMTVNSYPCTRDHLSDPRVQAVADRLVWSCADAVISPCEAVAAGLADRRGMPASLGRTVYYGVSEASCEPRAAAELRGRLAPSDELLVGMVSARPEAQKGYGVLLEALAACGEGVRGVIVGPTPESLPAEAIAAGVQRRLSLEGRSACVGRYYGACDLIAVPSTISECTPLVIIEAASVGTPAFASRLSGIPELIADGVTGRLFEPGSAAELAALIRAAQEDRERISAMGHTARERWLERFQPATMVRSTLACYGEASPRSARRAAARVSLTGQSRGQAVDRQEVAAQQAVLAPHQLPDRS